MEHTVWSSDTETSTASEIFVFKGFDSLSRAKLHASILKSAMPERFFFVSNGVGVVVFRAVSKAQPA